MAGKRADTSAPAWAAPSSGARTARIDIQDTPANAVLKLVENDRAAAEACIAMVQAVATADPQADFGPFTPLLILEQIGLTGARIGRFYQRVCAADAVTALGVLHAVRLGLVPADVVKRAADGKGQVRTDAVLDLVRARLPQFGR